MKSSAPFKLALKQHLLDRQVCLDFGLFEFAVFLKDW